MRVAKGETLYPIMKARTLDFAAAPAPTVNIQKNNAEASLPDMAPDTEPQKTTERTYLADLETPAAPKGVPPQNILERPTPTHVVFDIGGVSFDEVMQELSTGRKGEEDD